MIVCCKFKGICNIFNKEILFINLKLFVVFFVNKWFIFFGFGVEENFCLE